MEAQPKIEIAKQPSGGKPNLSVNTGKEQLDDIDKGPQMPVQVEEEKKQGDADKVKKKMNPEKLYEVMKALTAMKLVKEDGVPAAVYDDIFLGSIGAAYNKEEL